MCQPRPPPRSTLFPYTTLFRSVVTVDGEIEVAVGGAAGVDAEDGVIGASGRAANRREQRERDVAGECGRSEEHTSELQSQSNIVCRLLLEKKKGSNGEEGVTAQ